MRKWKKQKPEKTHPSGEANREAHPLDPAKARARTFQRAVKLLAAKPRSIAELRERLLEKQWTTPATVDAVIEKLREYGYLNDERFAFGYASFRVRQKPVGRARLARDLALKKVERETADEAIKLVFEEHSEEELIDRAVEKRVRLRGLPRTHAEAKSLFDHLLRLGFSYDLVIGKVRALPANIDADETASE